MLKIFIGLIAAYLIFVLIIFFLQRQLIYFPDSSLTTPEDAGVPEMKIVQIHTDDGLTLNAWYRPPQKENMPTIIYFHGNAGHIGNRAVVVKPFLKEGYGMLLTTYRGYSGNPGKPNEKGLYRDGRAAMEFIKSQGIKKECIVLYGNSIGSAVAVQIASEFSVGGLILQSPFPSLAMVGQYHYPYLPVKWFLVDRFDSAKKAVKVKVPVLILHGEQDLIIPLNFGKRLFNEFIGIKEMEIIHGNGHNDLLDQRRVMRFIRDKIQC